MIGRLKQDPDYLEETFGILTDDDIYLDCILVRPRETSDEALRALRVWVPRHPLTKASTIVCARQEVQAYGPEGKIAHLVFDLRGTGDSEGLMEDFDFEMDLKGIRAWAEERFGPGINFGFLGSPTLSKGRVNLIPIRPNVIMESYYYPTTERSQPTLLYLSTYGNFDRLDDARCTLLSNQGYEVYGLDPMRYLLHASYVDLLTPEMLAADLDVVCDVLEANPYLVGFPISAGLALLWGSQNKRVSGVTSIGVASPAFRPKHIFNQDDPAVWELPPRLAQIPPRPLTLVWQDGHSLGGNKAEMAALYKASQPPHRLERTKEISPQFLHQLVSWQRQIKRV